MKSKPNLVFDQEQFSVLQGKVGVGKIVELSMSEAALVAPHIKAHPDTFYAASSGIAPSAEDVFKKDDALIAIEWVREETKPQPGEPEINTYRYLLGVTKDDKCVGYDVTRKHPNPGGGQVADHWTTLDEVLDKHFPK